MSAHPFGVDIAGPSRANSGMGMMKPLRDSQFLDTKLFKAFMAAAEAENFTLAGQTIHMTQSGISQHIARLEEQVNLPLFKRTGKHVALTEAGKQLREFVMKHASFTRTFLDDLQDRHHRASGLVSYAMPASCLLSPHFAMLLAKRRRYPEIRLNVTLAPTQDVLDMILEDKVDFGFADTKIDHPSLHFRTLYREEYILVGAERERLENIDTNDIVQQPYVTYPGSDFYFERWLMHSFPHISAMNMHDVSTAGYVSSIEGAIKMVEGGLGISVFPRHCVIQQLERGELFEYASDKSPTLNNIYITTIANHTYPRAVHQVIDWFSQMQGKDITPAR